MSALVLLLTAFALAGGGFTAGACWEHCRAGGTADLRDRLTIVRRHRANR